MKLLTSCRHALSCAVDLQGAPYPPRRARHAVQELLARAWGCSTEPERVETALLVVSELVTNACRHTPGPLEMRVSWDTPFLTIEVDDLSQMVPTVTPAASCGAHGGYGLHLIDELAVHRSTEISPQGKTVQVILRTD
ncbi:ATP-binding protein [Streptomyces nojiriensis]|uniref:ATP-binding protein n=1 Tax=Streptomyces nojiriensis TaxID=66374 RepID=UPI0035DC5AC3